MLYLTFYTIFGVCVGILAGLYIVGVKKLDMLYGELESLDDGVRKGHIQKETYGERNVYYKRDFEGEEMILGSEVYKKFRQKHPQLFLLSLFLITFISVALAWPYYIYYVMRKEPTK